VIADLYFVSTRQFADNKWATKNPIMKRDTDLNMVRIQAFGKFAFKVTDVAAFMREIFGTKGMVMTYDIVEYLSSMVSEIFSVTVGESAVSVLDLSVEYKMLSSEMQKKLNEQTKTIGIQFSDVIIESISLPEDVEKLIDEQSGIGMAKRDMNSYVQYQTAKAMRDAARQEGGLAGLGAGMALGNTMANNIQNTTDVNNQMKSKAEQLRELKSLLDEGILTKEEFNEEKKEILSR
jgi:membrane protease subunit (stomatin/prohibitin family)